MMTAAVMCGCSSVYYVDLKADRERNLSIDREVLQQNLPVLTQGILSPKDAVKTGLANSLDLRISQALIEIADDTARSEKLRMLPSLNLSGDLSYRDKYLLREFRNLETDEIQLSNTVSEERFRKTTGAVLTWNLLDFGLSFFRARQAAHQSEIRRIEQHRQSQTLALDIMIAYRQAALAEANLQHILEMTRVMEKFKASADAMVEERRLDPIVAREIERELASLAVTAGDLQAEVSGARITLCRLMGVNPSSRFEISPEAALFDSVDNLPNPDELNPARLEAVALHQRPELFTSDLQARIQQDEARAALVNMFPGIRLDASFTYDDNRYLVNNHWTTIGAGLVMDLLTLPSQWYVYEAQKKGVERVRLNRLMLTASVIAQVHLALHEFGVRREQYRLYQEAYDVYDDLLQMTRERNAAGVAGFPDTLVTQRIMEAVVARIQMGRQLAALLNAHDTLAVSLGLDYGNWGWTGSADADVSPERPTGIDGTGADPPKGRPSGTPSSDDGIENLDGIKDVMGDFYPFGTAAHG